MTTKRRKYTLPKKPRKNRFYKYTVPGVKRSDGHGTVTNTVSLSEKRWLDKLGVPIRGAAIKGFNRVYIVDGFDPRTNTVYEYLGDIFHGALEAYPTNRDRIHPWLKKTPNQLYFSTKVRFQTLRDFGFKVFYVWEHEFKRGGLGHYYTGNSYL